MSETKATPVPESPKPEVPGKMSVSKSGKTAPTVEVVGLGTFAVDPQKPEKAAEAKAAPAAEPQKPKTAEKASEAKATTKQKKSDAAAKVADVKATSATESPKPEVPEKAPTAKPIPTAEPPVKAEAAASSSKAADGPKGVVVTQVFADRLDYPDEAALQSLPIPKEGEGFSMRLHPAYFFQFLDHPFSINREVKDYRELYFWGGKSRVLGWDSRWGQLQLVWAEGSETTGTYRPYGLDCSGFVDWVFYNASGGEYLIGHGGGAYSQHTYCTDIPWSEAQPGDLVFYPEDEHVGIVGGWDESGNLLIIHCTSGSLNNVVITEASGFAILAEPLFYGKGWLSLSIE